MTRLALAAGAGFVLGAFWLLAIGVPIVMPSWLELRDQRNEFRELARGQKDAFDESEAIRADENTEAVSAVEGERMSCDEQLSRQEAFWRRRLRDELEDMANDETTVSDRGIRPLGELLDTELDED